MNEMNEKFSGEMDINLFLHSLSDHFLDIYCIILCTKVLELNYNRYEDMLNFSKIREKR